MAKKDDQRSLDTFREITSALKKGEVRPVYGLFGEEAFLIDLIQKQLIELIPQDLRDFNMDMLYGQDATLAQVLGACKSFPMMAERRLVIVRDFFMLAEKPSADAEGDEAPSTEGVASLNELIPYLEQPNPSTILVLIDTNSRPNGNTKLGKAFKHSKSVLLADFTSVPVHQLPDWIVSWSSMKYGHAINDEAANTLAQQIGHNLLQVSNELDKLVTFKGDVKKISAADIHQLVGETKTYDVFSLQDAIVNKKTDQALYIAERMLYYSDTSELGESLRLIAFFTTLMMNIWQIHRFKEKSLSPSQIKAKMGIGSDFYFNNLLRDASKFTGAEITLFFETLLDADKAIKGYSKIQDPKAIFLLTIKRLTQR